MPTDPIPASIIDVALRLRTSHPHAPARDVLDLVMQGRTGQQIAFGDVSPTSPFGLIVVEAFDRATQVSDWIAFYRQADPRAIAVFDGLWRDEVWPVFTACYGIA